MKAEAEAAAEHAEEGFDAGELIMHHILDSHEIEIPFTGAVWKLSPIEFMGLAGDGMARSGCLKGEEDGRILTSPLSSHPMPVLVLAEDEFLEIKVCWDIVPSGAVARSVAVVGGGPYLKLFVTYFKRLLRHIRGMFLC